jgi:hypothetical protein
MGPPRIACAAQMAPIVKQSDVDAKNALFLEGAASSGGDDGGAEDARRVVEALRGSCLRKTAGVWSYEVCLGASAKQIRGASERFDLGRYSGPTEVFSQAYDDGTPCSDVVRRSSTVRFACADELALLSVTEPSMCRYVFSVGVPQLCGIRAAAAVAQESAIAAAADDTEPWVLLASLSDNGVATCTLRHVDDQRGNGFLHSAARFSQVRVTLRVELALLADAVVQARRSSRQSLAEAELRVPAAEAAPADSVTASTSPEFRGSLEMLSVSARVVSF